MLVSGRAQVDFTASSYLICLVVGAKAICGHHLQNSTPTHRPVKALVRGKREIDLSCFSKLKMPFLD